MLNLPPVVGHTNEGVSHCCYFRRPWWFVWASHMPEHLKHLSLNRKLLNSTRFRHFQPSLPNCDLYFIDWFCSPWRCVKSDVRARLPPPATAAQDLSGPEAGAQPMKPRGPGVSAQAEGWGSPCPLCTFISSETEHGSQRHGGWKAAWGCWSTSGWTWASSVPRWPRRPTASWLGSGIVRPVAVGWRSCPCTQHWWGRISNTVFTPHYKKDIEVLEHVQKRATRLWEV